MRLFARPRRLARTWAACFALFAIAAPSQAQDTTEPPVEDAAEQASPLSIELDYNRLLFESQNNTLQDPVWRLQASVGKRLVFLPFTVDEVEQPYKLSRLPFTLRAGRFVGFIIPKPDQPAAVTSTVDLAAVIQASPKALQDMLFAPPSPADPLEESLDGLEQLDGDTQADAESSDKTVPETAPRLAREITLHPDGTVHWEMDRVFHAAELQPAGEQNPYAYKIDAEQLRVAQPERPERLVRAEGEDPRAYADRKRQQQLEDRDKQEAYRALRDMLRELPEAFSETVPNVLYAVIEVPDDGNLSLQGPAPLPWTVDAETQQMFTQLAQGGAMQDDQGRDLANKLTTMIAEHPLNAQAIAMATMRGRLAGQVKTDDAGYRLLSTLLTSNDQATRRITLYGVATTNPPTLASAQLIGFAGQAVLGEERELLRFLSLREVFATQISNAESTDALIDQANLTLGDPGAGEPARILAVILDAVQGVRNTSTQPAPDETIQGLIQRVAFDTFKNEQIDAVIEQMIRRAPVNPVAAGWLDVKLLGSDDPAVVDRTLALLARTKIVRPVEPADDDGLGSEAVAAIPPPAQPQADPNVLTLDGTIPLTSAEHKLLELLGDDNAQRRLSAWLVLDRFHIALPKPIDGIPAEPTDPPAQAPAVVLFESVLAQAKLLDTMSARVVDFMAVQQDDAIKPVAESRLVGLLADADADLSVAKAAAAQFLATPQRYTQAITALDSTARLRLMESLYRAQDAPAPLMAGLIADGGTTLGWLTAYVQEQGVLPNEEAWSQLATSQGESTLLAQASSQDNTLAAAAAAAMVVSVGGDQKQEQAFAQAVAMMQARTSELVQEQWQQQRGRIFADAFKRVQGPYQFVVTLKKADPNAVDGIEQVAPPADVKRIELGVVQLRAEGAALSLSIEAVALSPVPDRLGIRIDQAASLRAFNNAELAKLPLDQLNQPIDLIPEAGGPWSGEIALPDGRTLGVSLEPAG